MSNHAERTAVVTGGAGYLGGHLCRTLRDGGWRVRALDLKRTKYVPEGVELVEGDMRRPQTVRRALEGAGTVFHLAFVQSMSRLPESVRREINVEGTSRVVEAALAEGVSRFVHTSTIEIYGTRPPVPCREDAPTDSPVGWYGRHKLECERLVFAAHREKSLPAVALRMPTICGPGAYNHRPLLSLMDRILAGKPVAVAGRGAQLGDFVHVDDVLQGYLAAARSPRAVGEAFNISSAAPVSHREMISAMARAVGSRSRLLHIPMALARGLVRLGTLLGLTELPAEQEGYLFHDSAYSTEKARRLMGYAPRHTAAEAAAALIRSYAEDRAFVRARSVSY